MNSTSKGLMTAVRIGWWASRAKHRAKERHEASHRTRRNSMPRRTFHNVSGEDAAELAQILELPTTHHAALEMLYRRVAPDKLEDGTTIPTILGKFHGREEAMYQLLQRMYPAETILRPPR